MRLHNFRKGKEKKGIEKNRKEKKRKEKKEKKKKRKEKKKKAGNTTKVVFYPVLNKTQPEALTTSP